MTCTFCKGKPVQAAESWLDGQRRPPAACPRCGETNRENALEGDMVEIATRAILRADRAEAHLACQRPVVEAARRLLECGWPEPDADWRALRAALEALDR